MIKYECLKYKKGILWEVGTNILLKYIIVNTFLGIVSVKDGLK